MNTLCEFKNKLKSILVFDPKLKNGYPTRTVSMEMDRLDREITDAYLFGIDLDQFVKVFQIAEPLHFFCLLMAMDMNI